MKDLNQRLTLLKKRMSERKTRIMIIGLGSVGGYLLDYLLSNGDENLEIFVAGRNREKMVSDVNIARVASLIRQQNHSTVTIIDGVDLNDVSSITKLLSDVQPDIIINSSRAYAGLKYGSISWKNVRAYGIWAPLSIKYVKNIMKAYDDAGCEAIVINTSYSDAVIPWLKSAGMAYPDFGSGNVNHLIPRIKFAVAEEYKISDFWNIEVTFATSHFHDVVISKEGQTEGLPQLIKISYQGKVLTPDMDKIFAACKIPMPVDSKRNMMNASSNYEIITAILQAIREQKAVKLHIPGAFGHIGGYPVVIDGRGAQVTAQIDESVFSLEEMSKANRKSIYLDGIENVENGTLTYTDELLAKVKKAFNVDLVKNIPYNNIDDVADFIIKNIIEKNC